MTRTKTASSRSDNWLFCDLEEADLQFVAGMFFARGKVYVGRGRTNAGSDRWSASATIETAERTLLLERVFGEPTERTYYGRPAWRYSLHDRSRIYAFVTDVARRIPDDSKQAVRLEQMRRFCAANATTSLRDHIAEQLRA